MNLRISHGQAIRSVFGLSLVTHFIVGAPFRVAGSVLSGRFSAEQDRSAVVLVEPVEERRGDREQLLVLLRHREAAQEHVEAGRLGGVVALVVEVGLVHDLPSCHKTGSSRSWRRRKVSKLQSPPWCP